MRVELDELRTIRIFAVGHRREVYEDLKSRNFGRREDDGDSENKLEDCFAGFGSRPNFPPAVLDLSCLGKAFTIMPACR